MKLSVVIPVMNEEENIKPLLDAVYSALDGRFEYELILVDDGSTDGTVSQVEKYGKPTRKFLFSTAITARQQRWRQVSMRPVGS